MITFLLLLPVFYSAGCESRTRVWYEGTQFPQRVFVAVLTAESSEELRNTGYVQIGIIRSEATFRGVSVSKQVYDQNSQAVLDSIAPENSEENADYYASLDNEMFRLASKIGGEKVRLKAIERTYPEMREDVARVVEEALAEDLILKFVSSVKYWSVWRRDD